MRRGNEGEIPLSLFQRKSKKVSGKMKKNVDLIVFGQDLEISREYFRREKHLGGKFCQMRSIYAQNNNIDDHITLPCIIWKHVSNSCI